MYQIQSSYTLPLHITCYILRLRLEMQYPTQKNNITDAAIIITIYDIDVGVITDRFMRV